MGAWDNIIQQSKAQNAAAQVVPISSGSPWLDIMNRTKAANPSMNLEDIFDNESLGGASGFLNGLASLPDLPIIGGHLIEKALDKVTGAQSPEIDPNWLPSMWIKAGANDLSQKLGGVDNMFDQAKDTLGYKVGSVLPAVMTLNPALGAESAGAGGVLDGAAKSIFSAPAKSLGNLLSNLGTSTGAGAGTQYISPYINSKLTSLGYPKTAQIVSDIAGPAIGSAGMSLLSAGAGSGASAIQDDLMGATKGAIKASLRQGKDYVDAQGNTVPLADAQSLLTKLDNQKQTLIDNGYFDSLSNTPKIALTQTDQALATQGANKAQLINDAEQANATVPPIDYSSAQKQIDTLRLGGATKQADDLQSILDANKANWNNGYQTITEADAFKQAADANGNLFKGPLNSQDTATKSIFKSLYGAYKNATNTAFDDALPDQAGDLQDANTAYGALKQAQLGASDNVASGTPSILKSIFQTISPQSVKGVFNDLSLAGSAVNPLLAIPAAVNFAAKVGAENYPATTQRLLTGLSQSANPLAVGIVSALSDPDNQDSSPTAQPGIAIPPNSLLNFNSFANTPTPGVMQLNNSPQTPPALAAAFQALAATPADNSDSDTPMPQPQDTIAAIKADPYYNTLAQTESSWNPNAANPKSTAKGLFQFTDGTANLKTINLKNPYDIPSSFKAVQTLTNDNINELSNVKGFDSTDPEQLYAAHVLGAPLYRNVLEGSDLSSDDQALVNGFYNDALPHFQANYALLYPPAAPDATGEG